MKDGSTQDSPKGDVSRFVRMSQDHTNYNMSLVSVQVRGITDLEASAEVTCPESGNVIGRISLRQGRISHSASRCLGCLPHLALR